LAAHEQVGKSSEYWVQYIKSCEFPIRKVHLPHDAKQHHGALSWEEQFRTNFPGQVSIVKNIGVMNGINAAKLMFPIMYFDQSRCDEGITALTKYRFEVKADGKGVMHSLPVHDKYSNFADSFRYLAVALRPEGDKPKPKYNGSVLDYNRTGRSTAWMGI
jgi:phage terminase large subunit